MVELRETKAKAETEVKISASGGRIDEKVMSASKYELHVLKKELHHCVEERGESKSHGSFSKATC